MLKKVNDLTTNRTVFTRGAFVAWIDRTFTFAADAVAKIVAQRLM